MFNNFHIVEQVTSNMNPSGEHYQKGTQHNGLHLLADHKKTAKQSKDHFAALHPPKGSED